MFWLEKYGENDYRLFDAPPSGTVGLSYDFTSLHDALLYAKTNNLMVFFGETV